MRIRCLPVLAVFASFWLGAAFCPAQPPTSPVGDGAAMAVRMDQAVAAYRKIIVLMDGSAALDEGNRERVRTAAWILFEQNHDRVDQLEQELSADAASNAGFAFYRMGQYDEAAKWFLQTIALDPRRAIAWLNLGDAYINLQKKTEAKDAYEKFLVVAPNSKSASDVCGKIQCLP